MEFDTTTTQGDTRYFSNYYPCVVVYTVHKDSDHTFFPEFFGCICLKQAPVLAKAACLRGWKVLKSLQSTTSASQCHRFQAHLGNHQERLIKWAQTRASVAITSACQKFESNDCTRRSLLDAGEQNIVRMSRNDKAWGFGQYGEAATARPYRQDHKFDPYKNNVPHPHHGQIQLINCPNNHMVW